MRLRLGGEVDDSSTHTLTKFRDRGQERVPVVWDLGLTKVMDIGSDWPRKASARLIYLGMLQGFTTRKVLPHFSQPIQTASGENSCLNPPKGRGGGEKLFLTSVKRMEISALFPILPQDFLVSFLCTAFCDELPWMMWDFLMWDQPLVWEGRKRAKWDS